MGASLFQKSYSYRRYGTMPHPLLHYGVFKPYEYRVKKRKFFVWNYSKEHLNSVPKDITKMHPAMSMDIEILKADISV